jgi:uncharacterized protein involved in outer membrane biogenesis
MTTRLLMTTRRWLALILGLVLVGGAVTLYWLPQLVRHVAIARIQALTHRPVGIEAVELNVLTGRFTVRGFRLAEPDGKAPFADFERLDVRLHLPSLLLGHLWIREMVLSDSTVRVVRLPTSEFNFSDLIRGSGSTGRALDVTVDRFALVRGTVTLEDQALSERRTWTSEHITIEAHNLSTRRADGSAVGKSVTAGAPVSVEVKNLRLYPMHLQATVTVEGLDLTPVQVYFPPDASIRLDRGRASTSVTVALDARDGIRADATARFEDVALVRPDGGEPLALVPELRTQLSGFGLRDGDLQLKQLAVEGTMSVRDPTAKPGARLRPSSIRASVADLTWPARTPGRLDLLTSIPGGGTLAVVGTLRPPPAATELNLRLANLNLAPWAQLLPMAARVTGLAEANLRMNEPLAAGIPARVQGTIAVNRLGVADARQELLGAQRVEASGLELHWPTRLVVKRVLVSGPRGIVERDRAGGFPLKDLASRPPSSPATSQGIGAARAAAAPPLGVEIGEVIVRDGAVAWRDETVSPAARLDVSSIDAGVKGVGWPLHGPLDVRVSLRPPGGGRLQVTGRVGLEPPTADLRLAAKNAELAPYQPYLPLAARVRGAADFDVAVAVPSLAERRATARGNAALLRVDVRDGERTVMKVERASATGLEVDWPQRIAINHLALARPWVVVERDEKGALPLRALLTPRSGAPDAPASASAASTENGAEAVAVTVARLAVDDGGMRVVDRAVSPSFAVDLDTGRLRMEGLSTASGPPARIDLTARVAGAAELVLRGTIGAFGGPLRVDVNGELREFAVPRANPYLLRQVGWKTREGRLTTKLRCRIDGDALSVKTDIRLSRLQLVRAGSHDEAQTRIGLPLGLITALMKDRRGDINVSFPVGGRLSDPRFDFREAIWGAVRTVAVNAITLPVSWIGRVQISSDSRIQRIQVDPLPFEPGAATLTPEGQARVARLAAFLEQLTEVKMALTPVVSSRDIEELRRRALEATIDRIAREGRLSRDAAAARLFEQRFPDRPASGAPEAMLAALLEREPMPTSAVPELGARRLEAVRATVKQAGIDGARLAETKLVEREGGEGRIELEVLEPDTPRPSKVRDVLRRLGVPLKGSDAEE